MDKQKERSAYALALRENPLFVELVEALEAKVRGYENDHWTKPLSPQGMEDSYRTVKVYREVLVWIKGKTKELKI